MIGGSLSGAVYQFSTDMELEYCRFFTALVFLKLKMKESARESLDFLSCLVTKEAF